jgi:tRNA U34 5-carboxymethylaminomethyl modifying GTPase MnmE/TrmE
MASVNRTIGIHFQVNEQERKLIQQRMEQTGIKSLRAYMLKMATDGQVIHLDVSGVREMLKLLSNATNNINQIAKRVNETGNFYAADLEDLRKRYDEIWGQAKLILRKLATL